MDSPLIIYKRPRLRNPRLIVGWTDAGLVGTSVVDYLIDKLEAEEFAEIEPYDFSLLPHVTIEKSVLEEIEYPRYSFHYWKNKKTAGDLIIMGSRPPAIHHYEFANLLLDVAELFNVSRIYTAGGLPANTTHTETPKVSAIINEPRLKKLLSPYDVELGMSYHGPSSINGLIIGLAKDRNIEGISLWGQVPSYIGDIANPRVCETVLRLLTRILGIAIDFSDIEAEVQQTNKQIDELVSYLRRQNSILDQHIGKLEKGIGLEIPPEDRQIFFEDIERFLKQQNRRRENGLD
ncbi:MAG: PAC2 family protein [Chloroflexi bacterium]|nr:PAC2 family protein [Chloroflexota bacterium]